MEQSNLINFKYTESHMHALYDIFEPNGISMLRATPVPASSQAKQSAFIRNYADIAVFPNRAEGGTNLVAMECIASGIPTILNPETGQRDLLQYAVALCDDTPQSLNYLIANVCANYSELQAHAISFAKDFREKFTWENTCRSIIRELRAAQLMP
jgi:glycosyltransferase involved in cell wall biosynthesis